MVNGVTGKMGFATAEAAAQRGLTLIPVAFSGAASEVLWHLLVCPSHQLPPSLSTQRREPGSVWSALAFKSNCSRSRALH